MIQYYANKDLIEGRSCFATPVKVYENNDGKKKDKNIIKLYGLLNFVCQ